MTPAYQPIDCARHSALELAIMRGMILEIVVRRPRSDLVTRIMPIDLRSRRGQEFLLGRTHAAAPLHCWRLDRLRDFRLIDEHDVGSK